MCDRLYIHCCGSSWTVWLAFAAHDKSSPVQWGALYLYPPLRQQQQPRRAHLEDEVYPQLFLVHWGVCVRSCVNSVCFSSCWGFVFFVICLASVVWSRVNFRCALAWCVWCMCLWLMVDTEMSGWLGILQGANSYCASYSNSIKHYRKLVIINNHRLPRKDRTYLLLAKLLANTWPVVKSNFLSVKAGGLVSLGLSACCSVSTIVVTYYYNGMFLYL